MPSIQVLVVLSCAVATLVSPMPAAGENSLAPMLARVIPTVVSISTEGAISDGQSILSDAPVSPSVGSGSIIDAAKGLILTDYHVIQDAETISVTLSDGRSFDAQTVGTDTDSDLAVIKIDAVGLTQLTMGDSDGLRVGDYVVAVGNPFGLHRPSRMALSARSGEPTLRWVRMKDTSRRMPPSTRAIPVVRC